MPVVQTSLHTYSECAFSLTTFSWNSYDFSVTVTWLCLVLLQNIFWPLIAIFNISLILSAYGAELYFLLAAIS